MFGGNRVVEQIVDRLLEGNFELPAGVQTGGVSGKLSRFVEELKLTRDDVHEIVRAVLDTVAELSTFDVQLKHYATSIQQNAAELNGITQSFYAAFEELSAGMESLSSAMSGCSQSFESIAETAAAMDESFGASNERIAAMQSGAENVSSKIASMNQDVNQLVEVVKRINEIVQGIDSIADRTNLLALNAAIEAARAGEAGKGFSIVAQEIRQLSDNTKELLASMDNLLAEINKASQQSLTSVEEAVVSINTVLDDLSELTSLFAENRNSASQVSGSIENLLGFAQKLDSNAREMSQAVEASTREVERISGITHNLEDTANSLIHTSESIAEVERKVDRAAKLAGELGTHKLFRLTNQDFIDKVELAINNHKAWLEKFKQIARTRNIEPLQTDHTRCSFGHFYYSVKPKSPEILALWQEIDGMHYQLHQLPLGMFDAIKQGSTDLSHYVREAERLSSKLVTRLTEMVSKAKELDNQGQSVF